MTTAPLFWHEVHTRIRVGRACRHARLAEYGANEKAAHAQHEVDDEPLKEQVRGKRVDVPRHAQQDDGLQPASDQRRQQPEGNKQEGDRHGRMVIEQTHGQQFYRYLRAHYDLPGEVQVFAKPGPLPIRPAEVVARLANWS